MRGCSKVNGLLSWTLLKWIENIILVFILVEISYIKLKPAIIPCMNIGIIWRKTYGSNKYCGICLILFWSFFFWKMRFQWVSYLDRHNISILCLENKK